MKIFFLIAVISSSFVFALAPEKPVDEQERRDKFAGVERMRSWDDEKKNELYRDLSSKPVEEIADKYKGDFDADELKDLKER